MIERNIPTHGVNARRTEHPSLSAARRSFLRSRPSDASLADACFRAMTGRRPAAENAPAALTRHEADMAAAHALYGLNAEHAEAFLKTAETRAPRAFALMTESARPAVAAARKWPGSLSNILAAPLPPPARALLEAVAAYRACLRDGAPLPEAEAAAGEALARTAHDPAAFLLAALRYLESKGGGASQPNQGEDAAEALSEPKANDNEAREERPARTPPPQTESSSAAPSSPKDGAAPSAAPLPQRGDAQAKAAARGSGNEKRPSMETDDTPGDYRVFTRRFDRTVTAEMLLPPGAPRRLPLRPGSVSGKAKRAAARFAAALAGGGDDLRNLRRAEYGERLDPSAWAAWLTGEDLSTGRFMRRARPETDEAGAVVLLVDNSGSMRGRPALLAAHATRLAAAALERAGYEVEILGYTTSAWRGGKSAELWRRSGSPAAPGRVTDLLHVIYKHAAAPVSRAPLAAMLRPEILKENVDGEAVLWALERLRAMSAARKTLIVISDGAPADDATQAANRRDYLADHLRQAVEKASKECELLAVGAGCDVSAFYGRRAMTAPAEATAEALFEGLLRALNPPGRRRRALS